MRYSLLLAFVMLVLANCRPEVSEVPTPVQATTSPAKANSALPFLYADSQTALLSWVEKANDSVSVLKYAELKNDEWQAGKTILEGTDWFVNWADFPGITPNKGHRMSHVLKKSSSGTYSYDVLLNLLPKGASQWMTERALHTDSTATEHGFVSALPYKDGFFITWLDGRNTLEDAQGKRGAMTLRAAEVTAAGDVINDTLLDNRICDCCQTTAAMTPNGPVVLYRDRSATEVRDMSIVRWTAEGWSTPQTVFADNWQIKGCPVNGPKAASFKNTLVMAWFTAANNTPKVQVVFSEDSGVRFDHPLTVSDAKPLGRVDVLLLNEAEAIVSWMEEREGAQFMAVKVNRDGSFGEPVVVSEMNSARQSGFPQMALVNENVHFAWTAIEGSGTQVKTAYRPKRDF